MMLSHILLSLLLHVFAYYQHVDGQPCAFAGYDLSPLLSLTNDLSITVDYRSLFQTHTYYLRPCSFVSASMCARNATACYTRKLYNRTTPAISTTTFNFGTWQGSSPTYSFPLAVDLAPQGRTIFYSSVYKPDGLEVAWQNGPIDNSNTYPTRLPRLTVIRYICDPRTPLANITAADYFYDSLVAFFVNTSLVCGPRNLSHPEIPRVSTLVQCVNYTGTPYSMSLCPRTQDSPGYYPVTMSNVTWLKGFSAPQTMPMNFSMFGQNRTQFVGSYWGSVFFTNVSLMDVYLRDAPWYGLNSSLSIMTTIAAFHISAQYTYQKGMTLIPLTTWCVQGQAPNRQLVIRYSNRRYTDQAYWNDWVTDFDVVLSESTNLVEVRYYKVQPSIFNVTIGIQGDDAVSSTTRIVTNEPLSTELAAQLQGATLSIYLTPPVSPAQSSSSSTGDSVFSSSSSSSFTEDSSSSSSSQDLFSSSSSDSASSSSSSSMSDSTISSTEPSHATSSLDSTASSTSSAQSSSDFSSSASSTSNWLTSSDQTASSSSSVDDSTSVSSIDSVSSTLLATSESSTWSETSSSSDSSISSSASSSSESTESFGTSSSSSSGGHSSSATSAATSSSSMTTPSSSAHLQATSSSSSSSFSAVSSIFQQNGDCGRWYAEQYIGKPLDEYVAALPPGSQKINFVMTGATIPLPRNFDVLFGSDIALNIAFMLELDSDDADALVMYVDVVGASGCVQDPSGSRRLLSSVSVGSLSLSAYILGNVTVGVPRLAEVLNGTSGIDSVSLTLVNMLQRRADAGHFVTPSVQVNVTGSSSSQDRSSSTGLSTPDDQSTASTFDWTAGRIAGVVIGCVVGFLLIVAALMCVLRRGQNDNHEATSKSHWADKQTIYWTGKPGVIHVL